MRAIIVAAGASRRIASVTQGGSKCLLWINGKTLIEHLVLAIKKTGITDIHVVVGHEKEKIIAQLEQQVVYHVNPNYQHNNNMASLGIVLNILDLNDDVLYLHSDLILDPALLADRLAHWNAEPSDIGLVTDLGPVDNEAMKVRTKAGRFVESSKDIPLDQAAGEWTGIAFFKKTVLVDLKNTINNLLSDGQQQSYDTAAFNQLASTGMDIRLIPTENHAWIEVDTPQDWEQANKMRQLNKVLDNVGFPVKLVTGKNSARNFFKALNPDGLLIVTSKGTIKRGLIKNLFGELPDSTIIYDHVNGIPDINGVKTRLIELKNNSIKSIAAVGGGSVLDTARVLWAGLASDDLDGLFASIVEAKELSVAPNIPLYCAPTTAGTGSEVTPWATLWDLEQKKKYSAYGPQLFCTTAVIDPTLTLTMPLDLTVSTALDALSHALEAIWHIRASDKSGSYAFKAIDLILNHLPALTKDLSNLDLREQIQNASVYAGQASSYTATGIAHSISYPLTLHYAMPHGLACGFLLPEIFKFNATQNPECFDNLLQVLELSNTQDFYQHLCALFKDIKADTFVKKYVSSIDQLESILSESLHPTRAGNNIRPVKLEDVHHFFFDYYKRCDP